MIIWNGREVAPQKIKRIQLGERIIYIRRSKLSGEMEYEFDLESFANGTSTARIESNLGFLLELASSPDMQLNVMSSDIAEASLMADVEMETELYVELTAPMKLNDPVIFVLETEAVAPTAAVCEMDETIPITFEAECVAPTTANTEQEEIINLGIELSPEANAADSVPLEDEATVFKLGAVAELKAANAANVDVEPAFILGIDSEMQAAGAALTEAFCGLKIEIEAELWIKPGEWISPVLKNNVLGITQAMSTIQSGSVIKIT